MHERWMFNALAEVVDKEIKKAGIFMIPGVCRGKTRVKPVTKAGKGEMIGQIIVVKARRIFQIVPYILFNAVSFN